MPRGDPTTGVYVRFTKAQLEAVGERATEEGFDSLAAFVRQAALDRAVSLKSASGAKVESASAQFARGLGAESVEPINQQMYQCKAGHGELRPSPQGACFCGRKTTEPV